MAAYTPTQLRDAAALAFSNTDALNATYDKMYAAAQDGGYGVTSDVITPTSVRDYVKTTLGTAGFVVTENEQEPTKLDISWETE